MSQAAEISMQIIIRLHNDFFDGPTGNIDGSGQEGVDSWDVSREMRVSRALRSFYVAST
jgi:hypothetical protein